MSEPNTNPVPILIRARDLIAAGWTQGTYDNLKGCYCAVGAIREASDERDLSMRWVATHLLALQIDPYCARGAAHKTIIEWNDYPSRKKPEVLALFDRAIAAGEKPRDLAAEKLPF